MPDHISTCERAARAAGEVLRQWRGRITAREKGRADLVTEADFAAQNVAQQVLRAEFPAYRFIGEESPGSLAWRPPPSVSRAEAQTSAQDSADYCWIVDPLDGTTNYVHGLPGWCVSVALARGPRVLAGCIYDPLNDHCYTADVGEGAYCNGQPVRVSDVDSLRNCLVAISLPTAIERDSRELAGLLRMLPEVQSFRRLGSAALNLCFLAAGQIDAYWATSVHPWDVAAGVLLVQEAGGVVSTLSGSAYQLDQPTVLAASQRRLHAELVQLLGSVGE